MTGWLLPAAAVFLAYFVKGIAGFGNTLVFSGMMGFAAQSREISPTDLLLGLPANTYMAYRGRGQIRLRVVAPLCLMLLLGMVPGVLLLRQAQDRVLKLVLGCLIMVLAADLFLSDRRPKAQGQTAQKPGPALLLIGLASGALCGLFGIGAFLVAYIQRTTQSSAQMRANLCCVFLCENLLRIGLYILVGLFTADILRFAVVLLPAMAAGLWAGTRAAGKLPEPMVRKAVQALVFVMGLTMVIGHL